MSTMLHNEITDVIIPTMLSWEDVEPQINDIMRTAGMPVRVIATCRPVCAAKNRNIGLDLAISNLRVMLDDDVTSFPFGWVVGLLQVLRDHPNCVMVSPQLIRPDGRYALMMGCSQGRPIGSGVHPITGPHLLTACIAFRKDDLRFEEGFVGSGFEDNDYCDKQRARYPSATWLVNHDIQVVHRNEMKHQREHFRRNREYYEFLKRERTQ